MTKRDKKLLVRGLVLSPLFLGYLMLLEALTEALEDQVTTVSMFGIISSTTLFALWLGLTADEWRWAPRRRFAVLRHLYLTSEAGPVELDVILGGLERCPIYARDVEFLRRNKYLHVTQDGEPTGDIHRDGRPIRAKRCRLAPAGRDWIEQNPVEP